MGVEGRVTALPGRSGAQRVEKEEAGGWKILSAGGSDQNNNNNNNGILEKLPITTTHLLSTLLINATLAVCT